MGAVPPPPPDRPGGRVRADGRSPLRRAGGATPAVVVEGKPVLVWHSLDKRYRGRNPADLLGLDSPPARRLGRRPGALRAERACPPAGLVAPDLLVRVPKPPLIAWAPHQWR